MKNESLTFAELKTIVGKTGYGRLPRAKTLRTSGVEIILEDVDLTVYSNGLFIFTDGNKETVFAVDKIKFLMLCGKKLEETVIDELPWDVVLSQIGYLRLDHNAEEKEQSHSEISICNDQDEYNAAFSGGVGSNPSIIRQPRLHYPDLQQETIDKLDREEKMKLITQGISILSETETQVFTMSFSFDHEFTQEEISKALGISQPAVSKALKRAIEKIKKFCADFGYKTGL